MESCDDPVVFEVRRHRSQIWQEARCNLDRMLHNAAEFVRSLGMEYCGLKPLKPDFGPGSAVSATISGGHLP